jgi:hypothetical protein
MVQSSLGPSFWSGIIYIIIVSTIMTIFELIFFTTIAEPVEINAAYSFLKNFNKPIGIQTSQQAIDILNVSIIREDKLNKKINNDAIVFVCLEILILMLLGIIFWNVLKHSSTNQYWTYFWTGIQPSFFSALIVCFFIILFQASMYDFGKHFSYPTSSELQFKIITKLRSDVGLDIIPTIPPVIPL